MKGMRTVGSVEEIWKSFREQISSMLEEHRVTTRHKKQQWMTEEILDPMKQRRKQQKEIEQKNLKDASK